MMSRAMKVAFVCHLLTAVLLITFGLVYLIQPEFMPYHADAVAKDWSDVNPSYQILILALMRAAGGGWLGSGVAIIFLLVVPFRQGHRWARWAILVIGLIVSCPALYATIYVRQNTPGNPPWMAVTAGIVLLVAGFILSLRTRGSERPNRIKSR